jgi:conjugative transfer signal peptidase TraF
MRRIAIGILVVFSLGCLAIASGLRWNGTASFPVGLYLATNKHADKGDLLFVNLPSSPAIEMAKERGYLNVAYSSVDHLLKRLAAVPGDRVSIDSSGVEVNGIRLANSTPLPCDGVGRPLQHCALKDHILGPGEVLLMSDYNPSSFDSRYFGPLRSTTIESVVTPLLTFSPPLHHFRCLFFWDVVVIALATCL